MEGVVICIKDHQVQHAIVSLELNLKTRHKSNISLIITIVFKGNNFKHKLKWTFTVTTILHN